jgi:hypothetical protein
VFFLSVFGKSCIKLFPIKLVEYESELFKKLHWLRGQKTKNLKRSVKSPKESERKSVFRFQNQHLLRNFLFSKNLSLINNFPSDIMETVSVCFFKKFNFPKNSHFLFNGFLSPSGYKSYNEIWWNFQTNLNFEGDKK